jgi:hypothetical protein
MMISFTRVPTRGRAALPAAWLAGLLAATLPHAAPAGQVRPFQAQTIEPFQAEIIEPYRAQEIAPDQGQMPQAAQRDGSAEDPTFYFRTWNLYVPGAAYVVSQPAQTYDKLVVSPGTGILHRLNIYPDGRFAWATPGGVIEGRWRPGEGDYPIVLPRSYEGKSWQVGFDRRQGRLLVWDGSTWFEARP